jgi:hypothetical protein
LEGDSVLRASTSGLSAAETHLLRAYRSEVAWLFRQVCLVKLVEGPAMKDFVSQHINAHERCQLLDKTELAAQADAQLALNTETMDEAATGLSLLEHCVRDPLGKEPSVAELAAASFRLEPTNQARLLGALDMAGTNRQQTALRVARDVLTFLPTEEQAVRAWECTGLAYGKLKVFPAGHAAYQRASSIGADYLEAHMNRFVFALQAGKRREAMVSSEIVEEFVQPQHPCLHWYTSALRHRRNAGEWAPTTDANTLAAELKGKLGAVGQRIIDVLN